MKHVFKLQMLTKFILIPQQTNQTQHTDPQQLRLTEPEMAPFVRLRLAVYQMDL